MLTESLQRLGSRAFRALFRHGEPEGTLAPATAARQLYREIVTQARSPAFYVDYAVPDTPDGRFDMIALHAALVMRRLRDDTSVSPAVSQALFDQMFAGFDESLREMGVGDLRVGKVVKAMAKGFYGRLAAYGQCLDQDDVPGLQDALRRNVYRHSEPEQGVVARLATYIFAEAERLSGRSGADLIGQGVKFRSPDVG